MDVQQEKCFLGRVWRFGGPTPQWQQHQWSAVETLYAPHEEPSQSGVKNTHFGVLKPLPFTHTYSTPCLTTFHQCNQCCHASCHSSSETHRP